MFKYDKEKFKGDKGRSSGEKITDAFESDGFYCTEKEFDKFYADKDKVDPVSCYENGAVVKIGKNGGFGYRGDKIEYRDGFARVEFIDSFGDELIEEDGELVTSECAGHLKVQIWGNEFDLYIETATGTVIEMGEMDIRLLKKLNNFLNYALNDKSIKTEAEIDIIDTKK